MAQRARVFGRAAVDGCAIRFAPRNETMVEAMAFVGIFRGTLIPGFLRWCEMDLVTIYSRGTPKGRHLEKIKGPQL